MSDHRSRNLQVEGGGNCGNALTAASRLGLTPCIVTKLGADQIGDLIEKELQNDGVDTSHIFRDPNSNSSSSYIVVDRKGDVTQRAEHLANASGNRQSSAL